MGYPGRVYAVPRPSAGPKFLVLTGPSSGATLTPDTCRLHRVFTTGTDAPPVLSPITSPSGTRSLDVVVVRSPACHLCEDALEVLAEMGRRYPLDVHVVEIDSQEGRAVVERFRPALSPAVVVDGRLFSSGRLPRRKLQRMLERMG